MPKVINLPGDQIGTKIIDGIVSTDEEKEADILFKSTNLDTLNRIAKLLYVILNHQRQITGIESDDEGDF